MIWSPETYTVRFDSSAKHFLEFCCNHIGLICHPESMGQWVTIFRRDVEEMYIYK